MAVLSGSWLIDALSVLTALVVIFVGWMKWCHGYWERKGLLYPAPSLLFGNAKELFLMQDSMAGFILHYYKYFRDRKQRHGGVYLLHMPSYMPIDPKIVKSIMQNDFEHFMDRGVYFNEETDPLSAHLFSLEGSKWRNLRVKLTPTFTSGKMKMMFETLVNCSDQLTIEMDKTIGKPLNIKDILIRFTTDIIGSCAFGINCNSLKNPDSDFSKYGKKAFEDSFLENIKGFFTFVAPDIMKKFGTLALSPSVANFFMGVVQDTIAYREKNHVIRKDFMHLLLQMKNTRKTSNDDGSDVKGDVTLTVNEIAAQCFVFFLAGFETSSTTMTFCLFELASNAEIQQKVREEVNEVLSRHNGVITYDAINEMHYMEKVVNETLRKYPPLTVLNRVCTKDYNVPDSNLIIEKGTKVLIPIIGIQRDPEYYPNPDKFDPDRFTEANKAKRPPYTFAPFGEGPRICIGMRFGIMQTKVGLTVLLKNYKFTVNPKTSVPLKYDPKSFILCSEGGTWLDYAKV